MDVGVLLFMDKGLERPVYSDVLLPMQTNKEYICGITYYIIEFMTTLNWNSLILIYILRYFKQMSWFIFLWYSQFNIEFVENKQKLYHNVDLE